MKYIIRANSIPGADAEPPTYWLPRHDGAYVRTHDKEKALTWGFKAHADALAYMNAQGVNENQQEVEILGVP